MARTAVKIAISLPTVRVEHLRAIQIRERKSLSALVDQALVDWLTRREQAETERQYREYYATEASHRTHRRLARQMAAAAAWPED